MKNVRTVIIGFSCFAVVALGVLGYGLYRRSAASSELDRLLGEADKLLRTELSEFAVQSESDQDRFATEVRTLQQKLQSNPDAPPAKADLLGDLLSQCATIRTGIEKTQRDLARVKRVLSSSLPEEKLPKTKISPQPVMQITPAKAKELSEAADAAGKLSSALSVDVAGRRVDLAPRFAGEIAALNKKAHEVRAELDRRELAITRFIADTEAAIRKKDTKQLGDRAADMDAWFLCVVDCPQRRSELAELEGRIFQGRGGPDQQKVLATRVDLLLASLKRPGEQEIARQQFPGIYREAQAGGIPQEKLKALVQARADIDKKAQGQAEAKAKLKARHEILVRCLFEIVPLAKKTTELRDSTAEATKEIIADWQAKEKNVQKSIAALKKLDPNDPLVPFLQGLLSDTNPETPKPPPASKTIVHWHGPNWKPLDDAIQKVAAIQRKYEQYKPPPKRRKPSEMINTAKHLKAYISFMKLFLEREKKHLSDKQAVAAKTSG